MANIDKVSVKNTVYNIVSPAVVSDYIEVIGGACTKPDGYVEDEVILAKQNDVQLLFKATQTIAFGANIVENTNCVRTTLEEVLKNAGGGGGASSADQVSYDNSDSGLEAENVQEAVDELATNAGTASSQIQTLTQKDAFIENVLTVENLMKYSLTSGSTNDVNYTVNPDTTISVTTTGTTQDNRFINMLADFSSLKNGETYVLSGCPSGGSTNTYLLYLSDGTDYIDVGSGVSFTYDSSKTYVLRFVVYVNMSISTPIIFKPMIRLASANDPTKPYAMTNQEMTPYVQAISNPNLLDNPWFTVNQRGVSTSVGGYIVDRWNARGTTTSTLSDGVLTITNTRNDGATWFGQRFDIEYGRRLVGVPLTWSFKTSSGEIKSWSFTLQNDTSAVQSPNFIINGVTVYLRAEWSSTAVAFLFWISSANSSVDIKAFKLEVGSVSTLAQDTAPNYQQELAKCQRYFVRLRGSVGMGFFKVADKAECVCPIPVPMRATPTATITNNVGVVAADGYSAYATGLTLWGEFPDACVGFDLTGLSHAADGSVCRLFTNDGGSINLSAEL